MQEPCDAAPSETLRQAVKSRRGAGIPNVQICDAAKLEPALRQLLERRKSLKLMQLREDAGEYDRDDRVLPRQRYAKRKHRRDRSRR